MAALTVYEVDLDWVPDIDYINSPQGIHYLAWKIGIDEKRQKALWFIEAVRTSPEPLSNLLPLVYSSYEFVDDTSKFGFRRAAETKENVNSLQERFLAEVDLVSTEVGNGYR